MGITVTFVCHLRRNAHLRDEVVLPLGHRHPLRVLGVPVRYMTDSCLTRPCVSSAGLLCPAELLHLLWSQLSASALNCLYFCVVKKSLPRCNDVELPLFSPNNFLHSGFKFKSLAHLCPVVNLKMTLYVFTVYEHALQVCMRGTVHVWRSGDSSQG